MTMSRVRSLPRRMVTLATRPSTADSTVANTRPTVGSGMTSLANSAAAYAPKPKKAAWPSDTMPV
ncbi:hypothetical protein D3C84_1248760 [compost metagenome]